ncbi:MAG: NAD(P)H-binding protein [Acidimicrobiales bacterium]|jgi:putative NADH-flavin reductase
MGDEEQALLNVVVFGATGSIGGAISAELAARGHRVVGVTRTGTGRDRLPPGLEVRPGDATDPEDVVRWARGCDAVISAIGPTFGTDQPQPFVAAAHALVDGLRLAGLRRLLVVGGAGSLEVSPGVQAVDTPEFPEAYRPNALAQRQALEYYRTVDDLDWTYVSPASEIGPGDHVGDYQLGHNLMLYDDDGISRIGYADFADGVVDCLEQGTHLRERITLAD